MRRKLTGKTCANCISSKPNSINDDLYCKYRGMVTAQHVCRRCKPKPQQNASLKPAKATAVTAEGGKKPVICLVAEGSYPYVTGGVSSWIQMLISDMTEYDFIIYAIGAEDKVSGKYAYTLPENVIGVQEVFLNTFLTEKASWGKRYRLASHEKAIIGSVLKGRDCDMEALYDIMMRMDSIPDFILSKSFFDIMIKVYSDMYSQISFMDYFWNVRSIVMTLFNILKQPLPRADIYHSVSAGYAGVIGALCKYKYNKPYLLTEHGMYTREREEEIIKSTWVKNYFKDMWIDMFYSFSKCAYNSADLVISLYSRNRNIQLEMGCDPEKTMIVPNGVKLERYNSIAEERTGKEHINIGAVVRVVPIKDIKTLLRALAVVSQELPNADFYIMGPTDEDPEYYEECINLVELLELKSVYFTGKINVTDYLGKMDVLVLSSISESQPLAVLEAMACRKPSVTTDVGSCRELLYGNGDAYGEAGIVVPVMDYVKIAEAILKLCRDDDLRKRMGNNGYNRVLALYGFEKFISTYKDIYGKCGGKC